MGKAVDEARTDQIGDLREHDRVWSPSTAPYHTVLRKPRCAPQQIWRPTSQSGQTRSFDHIHAMSGLPPVSGHRTFASGLAALMFVDRGLDRRLRLRAGRLVFGLGVGI